MASGTKSQPIDDGLPSESEPDESPPRPLKAKPKKPEPPPPTEEADDGLPDEEEPDEPVPSPSPVKRGLKKPDSKLAATKDLTANPPDDGLPDIEEPDEPLPDGGLGPIRPAVPGLPAVELASSAPGAPITARAVKSSMQLHKELKGVGRTLERMAKRVDQTLTVTRGVRSELEATAKSAKQRLQDNRSLTEDPNSPAGRAAAAAAVSEVEVAENLEKRFERPVTEAMLKVELKLEAAKERKRREIVNRPVVEALVELEETAVLGVTALLAHEDKLALYIQRLHDIYHHLASHYDAHTRVATCRNRSRVGKLNDHPTHESLALAAEYEDSARNAANKALTAAREQKSLLEAYKADVQRAMLGRTKQIMKFNQMDKAGTTFKTWTAEEKKLGPPAGEEERK